MSTNIKQNLLNFSKIYCNIRNNGILYTQSMLLSNYDERLDKEWTKLDSSIGIVLHDRYELIAEIGKGGMSTVYMAKDRNLGAYWAVKKVKQSSNNIDMNAFKKEVELLSSLNHSDIPRIVDRIELNDNYFVIMDLVNGTSLGKKIALEGPQPERQIIEWAKMLCDILQYLHTAKSNPIVYCDMKPDNVMLTESGRVKLIDFGIAKECKRGEKQTGDAVGSKGYAAPEQYPGASNLLDERTDIYSLGATLYNLVTGIVPGPPPNGLRPIRELNASLSEGLEYIIGKCTAVDPAARFQTCSELKNDLNNIEQLNSEYRKKMEKRLYSFCISSVSCFLCCFLIFFGYTGMLRDKEDKFQMAFDAAGTLVKQGNPTAAEVKYKEAIANKPAALESYQKLFETMLPGSNDKDRAQKTELAIDTLKKYVDDTGSPVYHNFELMYQIIKQCINLNNPAYASYAVSYIAAIKNSREFKDGKLNNEEIGCYEIIASNCANDITTQNFTKLNDALINLEKNTDDADITADNKLSNYYTIVVIYNNYPGNLKNAYTKTVEIGEKAKKIIDSNAQLESLGFNNIIPMYELVASSMYDSGVLTNEISDKRNDYQSSLEWFGYLDDLNDDLSETLLMKKANAHKEIFESYESVEERPKINQAVLSQVNLAVNIYSDILKKNPENFLAGVNLTQIQLDAELVKPTKERNYNTVLKNYNAVLQVKKDDKNSLTNLSLSQFGSLKRQMLNAGLEV